MPFTRWPGWILDPLLDGSRWVVITTRTPRIRPGPADATGGAQHTTRRTSAIDGRTTQHPGYAVSQRTRKRVEEVFGWLKTVGLLRKVALRGVQQVGWLFPLPRRLTTSCEFATWWEWQYEPTRPHLAPVAPASFHGKMSAYHGWVSDASCERGECIGLITT